MNQGKLRISVGQYSSAGVKPVNQDFYGAIIPADPQLSAKGAAVAIADGISSSDVSQIASETAVTGFLQDYYCTSDAWSVKTSALRVLSATNAWLFAQSQSSPHRFNRDKGYVCAFSALIIKSGTGTILHCGDTRIYRLADSALEQLTRDHRRTVSAETSYLTRALGVDHQLELDCLDFAVAQNDIFVLATDGVYEYLSEAHIAKAIQDGSSDLDIIAKQLVELALENGSVDNLTLQLVRIDALPALHRDEIQQQLELLTAPPILSARSQIEGYDILRELYISSRSHVFLAIDGESGQQVVIKTPSTEMRNNSDFLESMLMEEWIGRRINSDHVMKCIDSGRRRNFLYTVTEYIEGETLAQWMVDNPAPPMEIVRTIVEQIAKGLRAFHRQEMVHQDIRPNNIMIDKSGTVKIIDFGSTRVAGISETVPRNHGIMGTAQYTAPEYFLGQLGSARSDLFSLGVLSYQLLSGRLPYGTDVSRARTLQAQRRLSYRPLALISDQAPAWIDSAIGKATHIDPLKRHGEISEFIHELRQPSGAYLRQEKPPLIERNPILVWQCISALLLAALIARHLMH